MGLNLCHLVLGLSFEGLQHAEHVEGELRELDLLAEVAHDDDLIITIIIITIIIIIITMITCCRVSVITGLLSTGGVIRGLRRWERTRLNKGGQITWHSLLSTHSSDTRHAHRSNSTAGTHKG